MKRCIIICCVASLVSYTLAGGTGQPTPKESKEQLPRVQYARHVQPILAANCFVCHGPDEKMRKAGLRLDLPEAATKPLRNGDRAIVPGDPRASELVARIFSTDADRMPPAKSHKELKEAEKQLLKRWIEQGAPYERHWAFVAPQRPTVPTEKTPGWARNAVDRFVLARLEAEGLRPSPDADRYTLARRAALDLTGLPPTPADVDRFVNDRSADAYEKYVDHLLQSPAYGERWAHLWLDLARYADSNGYANDNQRTIWRYRDWVIEALNRNLTFDKFTIEQIAGDLLPRPAPEQLIATGFHRNTLTNDEGGTDDEEFRVAAVVDRVNTTMQVWMGVTMACAQCHDHKYDPFTQDEYFRLYAIFNNTEDTGKDISRPLLELPTGEQAKEKVRLDNEIAALEKQLKQKAPEPELKKNRERVAALRKEVAALKVVSTPIMRELPEGRKRITKIQIRGNFLDLGKQVSPGVPALFPPPPSDRPTDRLALARWLVDPANPLTARVAVNRYWEQIFGLGLVETPEDFGVRGKLPTHPELLDWLATEFVAEGWDVKKVLKLLVTSATYRQSSRMTPESVERDPENRLLARGPRFRGSAEVIHDQALFVGGLISLKMYGPPVRPPRPKLGLNAAFGGATDWDTSGGEDKYRRAMYTLWRRTTPYPSMVAFDAPARNVCTVRRARTNTPLQALVTLNDPVYVEAAQALGRRMVKEGGATVAERLRFGFRVCLTRPPQPEELSRLLNLYEKTRSAYAGRRKEAAEIATQPLGPLPPSLDPVDMAAWTVVGNVLLNLDEMFARR